MAAGSNRSNACRRQLDWLLQLEVDVGCLWKLFGLYSAFYLTTNFAVWAFGNWYPHTVQGLIWSYELALPFFRNTLLGDLFYAGLFIGSYELAAKFFAALFRVPSRQIA